MNNALTFVLTAVVKILITVFVLLTAVAYTVWLERKVVGRMQNRWGPSLVGPFGLLQPLADGAKVILREDLIPTSGYKPLYIERTILAVAFTAVSVRVITIGDSMPIGG